jgi:predicted TIM-barrel fold metal-dependent hydrolase
MDRQLNDFMDAMRPPGARDLDIRLKDLDQEGVWGQLAFPSMGFWTVKITDRELARETVRAWNDWAHAEILSKNKRVIPTAIVSTADIGDAVAELERAAGLGFQAVFLPSQTRPGEDYALEAWEPFWAAAERAGVVLGFHIGTGGDTVVFRGPGGAVINYMETTYPGMRVVSHLVAGGALDRHPDLRILIAEGGAAWVPAIGDRMDEDCPARSSASRCTRPSSTTRARCRSCPRRATATCSGEMTTRTWKAPTGTPRRRCAACSPASATRSASGSPAAPSTSCSACPPRPPPRRRCRTSNGRGG